MRLDNFLVEQGFFETRTKAKQSILRGEITVDGKIVDKCSFDVTINCTVSKVAKIEYVSLGGYKLEKALKDFNFCVKDLVTVDVGASAGGFTDCLLKNGASHVYSVDLRDDLLHESLKKDSRVTLLVKNAKDVTVNDFEKEIDLLVADLSFISLSHVLGAFTNVVGLGKNLIILIKPQFELDRKIKFKNGIVKDKKIHLQVCQKIFKQCLNVDLAPQAITTAPLVDGKNTEFLILLKKGGQPVLFEDFIKNL